MNERFLSINQRFLAWITLTFLDIYVTHKRAIVIWLFTQSNVIRGDHQIIISQYKRRVRNIRTVYKLRRLNFYKWFNELELSAILLSIYKHSFRCFYNFDVTLHDISKCHNPHDLHVTNLKRRMFKLVCLFRKYLRNFSKNKCEIRILCRILGFISPWHIELLSHRMYTEIKHELSAGNMSIRKWDLFCRAISRL